MFNLKPWKVVDFLHKQLLFIFCGQYDSFEVEFFEDIRTSEPQQKIQSCEKVQ